MVREGLILAEGDAYLVVAPDSNVLMNRAGNLLRFTELLDQVGSQIVEGQDRLTFTSKVLIPFTVTQELDRMKDSRSGQPSRSPKPRANLHSFLKQLRIQRIRSQIKSCPAFTVRGCQYSENTL